MELIIRSQNKLDLKKYNDIIKVKSIKIGFDDRWAIFIDKTIMSIYKSKERALEVLDEIQKLIKNQYIIELKPLLNKRDGEIIKKYYEDNYSGEFIMKSPLCEIQPINPNVVLYEMPKE